MNRYLEADIQYRNSLINVIRETEYELQEHKKSLKAINDKIDNCYEGKQGELDI
jgi:hypothetical protein